MSELTLIIGNKNYSPWSLRAWLALKYSGLQFEEIRLPLFTPLYRQQIAQYSPTGKVPVLKDGDLTVWDSIAICEYVAERCPQAKLWPIDPAARALARSISAEIHSGFPEIRRHLPMNIRSFFPLRTLPESVQVEIERVRTIWKQCLEANRGGGEMLFGHFTIADAMFAPIVTRFVTYDITLDPICEQYKRAVTRLPAMVEWATDAKREREVIESLEIAPERMSATAG